MRSYPFEKEGQCLLKILLDILYSERFTTLQEYIREGDREVTDFKDDRDFLGKNSTEHLRESFKELLTLARLIRSSLGRQAYLLDKYLSYMFEAASRLQESGMTSSGLDTASELRGICRSIVLGSEHYSKHPFYRHAKAYIEAFPLSNQESSTQEAIYVIALAHDFLEYMASQIIEKQQMELSDIVDFVDLRELYEKISGLLGSEEPMKSINRLFQQRFMLIAPISNFMQGLTSDLLYSLIYRDRETSRQIFQIFLDTSNLEISEK